MNTQRTVGFLAAAFVLLAPALIAQQADDLPLVNWPAPPYWAPPLPPARDAADIEPTTAEGASLEPLALPTEPLPFIAITPCRLIDTRNPVGTYGGPPLVIDTPRSFPIAGQCGVAANAEAVSVNVTVTNTQGGGWVALYPAGSPWPGVSTVNYPTSWVSVANAAIVPLGGGGFTALAAVSATDLIVDINGYYAPAGVRSVFGRTGNVVGAVGDYTASQVTNVPAGGITATEVQGALNGLDTAKAGIVHTHTGSEIAGLNSGGVTFGNAAGHLGQNVSQLFWDQTNNRLGIGTSAPSFRLDVNGVLRMPDTTVSGMVPTAGVLVLGGQGFLHNYAKPGSEGENTFVGMLAGNFTLGGTTSSEGSFNTAIGAWSLNDNTTGHDNTAVGRYSLGSNADGYGNTAVGISSLYSNTSGSRNIALGYGAGSSVTGSHNIDIGTDGVAAESNTIRLGGANQTRAFVAGIRGVTPGVSDGLAVIIDSNGQLGTSATVGAVTSVFGRTGAVTADPGDYTAAKVTNAPAGNVAATSVQGAINELDGEKAALAHTHSGADITSGTVAEVRIDATVARDSEIMSTVLAADGTGSTLDADLLDGQHASAFAGSVHTHWAQTWTGTGFGLTLGGGTTGLSASGSSYGVIANTSGQAGVSGTTTSTSGNPYGVSGIANGSATQDAGVYGRSSSDTGYGVAGHNYWGGVGVGAWGYTGDLIRAYSGDWPGGTLQFYVTNGGNVYANGTYNAFRPATAPDGTVEVRTLYAPQSPEPWVEDAGGGQLANGTVTVAIEPLFASTVDLTADYRVFLTPLGDCPLYVAEKGATSFTVRAMGGQTCSIAFDYRILARPKGTVGTRMAVLDVDLGTPTPRK
jgi:hypothetical protein